MIAMLSIEYFSSKKISTIFVISIIITAVITGPLLITYDHGNWLKNNMISNYLLTIIPMAYNPPSDVFFERAIHKEVDYYGYLPVIYAYDGKPRKILTDDLHLSKIEPFIDPKDTDNLYKEIEHSGIGYINFEPLWVFPVDPSKITIYHANKKPEYEYGNVIFFGLGGTSEHYQQDGWYYPEEDFTWTEGHRSVLGINTSNADSDLNLTVTASPFTSQQLVNVTINDHQVGEWIFDKPEGQEKSIKIPHEVLNEGVQYITFDLPDAKSPFSVGLSEDRRTLGLAVRSIVITNSTEPIYQ
jgi:hypothetical protein